MGEHEFIWRHLGNDFNLGTAFLAIVDSMRNPIPDAMLMQAEAALLRAVQNPEVCGRSTTQPTTETMAALGIGPDVRLPLAIMQMSQASNAASRHDRRAYLNSALRNVQEVRDA